MIYVQNIQYNSLCEIGLLSFKMVMPYYSATYAYENTKSQLERKNMVLGKGEFLRDPRLTPQWPTVL